MELTRQTLECYPTFATISHNVDESDVCFEWCRSRYRIGIDLSTEEFLINVCLSIFNDDISTLSFYITKEEFIKVMWLDSEKRYDDAFNLLLELSKGNKNEV